MTDPKMAIAPRPATPAVDVSADRDYWKQHAAGLGRDLDAVYRERAHLIAELAARYPSLWTPDETGSPDWRIVFITLPTGQCSWHIATTDWDLFPHVSAGLIGHWDGHTTDEKYERIRQHTAALAATPAFLITTDAVLSEGDAERLRADFQITARPDGGDRG